MSELLLSLSEALASMVQAVGPGVVRVEARRRLPASGIVWSSDGIIVTAHHVIERGEGIRIGLPDGHIVPTTLLGRDPAVDLAVLRAQATDLMVPTWGEPGDLQVGHLVLALARPGQAITATLGIVSALGQSWRTSAGGSLDLYLQTDVVMYPGFSGGPLVDTRGRVIGLNSSALWRGVSLAIPTPILRQTVETLLAYGRVRRGYLGVGAQPVRLPSALIQQLGQETGLLLASVEPESPAERGGLLVGDILVALDGQPMRHVDDLLAALHRLSAGSVAVIRIVRGGQIQELNVTIGERGTSEA